MNYFGSSDYWFWQGLEAAHKAPQSNPEAYLEGRLGMPTKANGEAIKAFYDGWVIGVNLTGEEFLDLTTEPKRVIIEEVKLKTHVIGSTINISKYDKIIGNC